MYHTINSNSFAEQEYAKAGNCKAFAFVLC